jgi:hypothetical protein
VPGGTGDGLAFCGGQPAEVEAQLMAGGGRD